MRFNTSTFFEDDRDSFTYGLEVEPRVRLNDSFVLVYRLNYNNRLNDRGFADFLNDEPIFGERDRVIVENSIRANYNFNGYNGLSIQLRHYWDKVTYDPFMYILEDSGRIAESLDIPKTSLENNPDVNFSTWNVDLNYDDNYILVITLKRMIKSALTFIICELYHALIRRLLFVLKVSKA